MLLRKKSKRLLSIFCIIALGGSTYLSASDDKDMTFGTNGKILELPENYTWADNKAVKVYSDDKILTAGVTKNADGNTVMALYRYLPDGSRDVSFGVDGASYTDHVCQDNTCATGFITGYEDAQDIMFQSDGKILIARTEYDNSADRYMGVARFNADGTLDTTFGYYHGYTMAQGGLVSAGAVQADDKILLVGYENYQLQLSRFNANGTLDTSFGTNGSLSISVSEEGSYKYDEGNDVAVQSDGKILAVGQTQIKGCGEDVNASFTRGLLLRFDSNGTLDSSFDSDGIVKFTAASVFDVKPWDLSETYPCQESVFKAVDVQQDGKIVVLGTGFNSAFKMFLARFNPDGSLDTTFGYQGVRVLYDSYDYTVFDHLNTQFTQYSGRKFSVGKMILQVDGSISVSGSAYYDGDYYHKGFSAFHFTKDGNFDRRYGTTGDAWADVNFPDDFLYRGAMAEDLAEQSNGRLILTGGAGGYDNPTMGVTVRMLKENFVLSPIISYLLN